MVAGLEAATEVGLVGTGNGNGLVAAALGRDGSVSIGYPKKARQRYRGHYDTRGRNVA